MDRRLVLAVALMLVVAILPQILFPSDPAPVVPADSVLADSLREAPVVADSQAVRPADTPRPAVPETVFVERGTPAERGAAAPAEAPPSGPVTPARTVTVRSALYEFAFSTRGAVLAGVALTQYDDLSRPARPPAQIVPDTSDFLAYRLLVGRDTVPLDDWVFVPDADSLQVTSAGTALSWRARRGAVEVRLTYRFRPDHYLFDVEGQVTGLPGDGGVVLVGLGPRLRSVDADTAADIQSYGVVTKARSTENLKFRSLDPGEREALEGPFEWVAIKSKYFVGAVMTLDEARPRLGGALAVGAPRDGRNASTVDLAASLPAPGWRFSHTVYLGPQEFRRLSRIGHDFEDVNPYGWIFRPIIRPFANFIVRILLWMHENLSLAYGWVLVLFGLAVRVLLWPLNQKAMRSSMEMQAIQPEVKAIQDRYKQDPQKMQQEVMKLYKEHKVNPLGGCLPMLIPMPILFALFFVFANTIEFRGVPFLWLPDLSRHDPFYIIPLLMGASMFAVSKLGQRGVPPNPQAKMMLYVMPPMFTLLFAQFSAGLNLYYAVSNIASIPQQWLISEQRIKRLGQRQQQQKKE